MKSIDWKIVRVAVISFGAGVILACVLPAIGQEFWHDRPVIGVEQAEQLTAIALDKIHEGDYKSAIHALHSAAFILEEGLGMHMGGPGMPMMGPGPMPWEPPHRDQFMMKVEETERCLVWLAEEHGIETERLFGALEEAVCARDEGRMEDAEHMLMRIYNRLGEIKEEHGIELPGHDPDKQEFGIALERTWHFMEELMERGAELEGFPGRIEEVEILFSQGSREDAWFILREIQEDLHRIAEEMEE